MRMTRVVLRLPKEEVEALDRLCDHYDKTPFPVSRAGLVRVMVHMGLVMAGELTVANARPAPPATPEARKPGAAPKRAGRK